MATRKTAGVPLATLLLGALLTGACTGGTESKAADNQTPVSDDGSAAPRAAIDAQKELASINRAIPIYEGAEFRDDLTRRDEVTIRNRYGADASVYTLASDDSFPQVYHYYTTYLAQFRAFPSQDTYPPSRKDWRTLEIQLNQAMQDPFFPSETPLGAFSLVDNDIFYSHSFLGRRLRPEQLIASLGSVASVSDLYDEKLVAKYGGETALEHLRKNAKRHRSVAVAAQNN